MIQPKLKSALALSFALHLALLGIVLGVLSHSHPFEKTASRFDDISLGVLAGNGTTLAPRAISKSTSKSPVKITAPETSAKTSSKTTAQTSTQTSDETSATPTGGAGPTAEASGVSDYFSELQSRIQSQERYPLEARKRKQEGVVVVDFELGARGELLSLQTHSESKFPLLEAAAKEAVEVSAPFPAPPLGVTHHFQIPIQFKLPR